MGSFPGKSGNVPDMDTTTRSDLVGQMSLSAYKIAKRSGVNDKTVTRIIEGEGRTPEKVQAVDRAILEFARERGIDVPADAGTLPVATVDTEDGPLIEVEITGANGMTVVVRGPIGERAALEESVLKLIAGMNRE